MAITQKSRWDDVGVEPPAGEARYVAGEQPIAEYDNWFNKAVVDDIAALNAYLDSLGLANGVLTKDIDADGHNITNVGNVLPKSDNAYNLGSESARWANLHVLAGTVYGILKCGSEKDIADNFEIKRPNNTAGTAAGFNIQLQDSAGNWTPYAAMYGQIVDPTDGSETGKIRFFTRIGGSWAARLEIDGSGNLVPVVDSTYNLGSASLRWKKVNSVSVVSDYVKAKWQGVEIIYVSPDGGGDGSSPGSPTTLDDALTRARARRVVIILADGEYHISKNYDLFGDYIMIKSKSDDASKVKIVFDTHVYGKYNVSYGLRLFGNAVLNFTKVTLENAPKANADYGWSVGGGAWAPITVTGDMEKYGVVMFSNCIVNQTRDYFISAKHGAGAVILSRTTINMSEDAIAFICNNFGVVNIGWYNSSITSGYKLTTGLQGRDVLFSGNISSVSVSKTWFSEVPESVIPKSDNAYDLGSASARWKNLYLAGEIYLDGDIHSSSLIKLDPGIILFDDANEIRVWSSLNWSIYTLALGGGSVGADPLWIVNADGTVVHAKFTADGTFYGKSMYPNYPNNDNVHSLGSSSLRWANVYAVNIYAGDINLDNKWRITEYDENGKLMNGVRILNDRGEEVFKITEDGVWFKGKKIAE